jgi:hypothetical protein
VAELSFLRRHLLDYSRTDRPGAGITRSTRQLGGQA